ncbi:hypothetical protein FHS29_006390 [Saccharothrix tamanrassetensis]|uniref:Secreted protein n=1 Tax=Saccharothrix tamanrassetensis TaxID=1051531 RepID=A0A841CR48_9PSEU|nr:hypothetical protein [Saccharothrix tamanrassetensis]MBB5959769.1 hypothetical protein [Saccharothrix tamanrassetensis]
MRKTKLFSLLAAASVMAAVSTVGASAAAEPQGGAPGVMAGGQCTGSWVDVHDKVVAKARPDAASPAVFTVYAGETFPCRKLVVGAGYGACGYTGANGWILVQDGILRHNGSAGWSGYIPSVCTSDR